MSTAGVFTLLINNKKADKLLNSYEFLKKRINEYITTRNGSYTEAELLNLPPDSYLHMKDNVLPSLNYIEQTHSVFVSGSYKPCVPVAFEYTKITAINAKFGASIKFTLQQHGTFINDMVLNIKLSKLRTVDSRDRVRYTSFPGHKLLENTKFSVQNHPLDEYTTDDYNAHFNRQVPEDKKAAWLRNVGQEIPELGYIVSDPYFDMHREYRWIGDGNQTFKQVHDEIDLFVPLLFWFNTDVKNSLPNHIIPWGQTDVTIKLGEVSDIVGSADFGGGGNYIVPDILKCDLYVNNIFVHPEIFNLYRKKFAFSLIRVHRHHKQTCSRDDNEVLLHNIKWPIESLYIAFRPRANLFLSQYWHKNTKLTQKMFKAPVVAKNYNLVITGNVVSSTSSTAILNATGLSSVDGAYNTYDFVLTGGHGYNDDNIVENRYTITAYNGTTKQITVTPNWVNEQPTTTTAFELFTPQPAINFVTYYKEEPVINSMSLIAHGIEIYKDMSQAFYRDYLPLRFGQTSPAPREHGSYLMNFNLYPDSRHPSGHLNISVARELYLRYTSSTISDTFQVDLIVLAKAINFLLVDEGRAALYYTL
jgi:hypothetical protein